jgi:hypothetical protein
MKKNLTESFRSTLDKLDKINTFEAKAVTVKDLAKAINKVFPQPVQWGEAPVPSHGYAEELFGTDDNNNANVWIQDNGDGTFDLRLIMDTEADGEVDQTDDETTISSVDEAVQWLDSLYNEYRIN